MQKAPLNRLFYLSFLLMLVMALILSACQPAAEEAPVEEPAASSNEQTSEEVQSEAAEQPAELVFARNQEPQTWDPAIPSDNGSIFAIMQVMDTLARVDEIGSGIEPALATSWDISEDGLEYIFHLREGVKFSNGEPLTVEDVVFSLNRAFFESAASYLYFMVDTVEAVDERTIQVTLTQAYSPFISALTAYSAAIYPKNYFEEDPGRFSNEPIGTGPYMVESYTRGEQSILVANPYYWEKDADGNTLPYLPRIVLKYVPEDTARILGLRNGDFHIINSVTPSEVESLQAEPDIVVDFTTIYGLSYIYLCHKDPPVDDVRFRQALNYATDRQAILENVYFGYGEIPNSYMPKMNYWDPEVPMIPFDPDKARELLAEMGYAGEEFTLHVASGGGTDKQTATMLQQMWSDVGINVSILEIDLGTFWDLWAEGDYMGFVGKITSDINDDDEIASLLGDYQMDPTTFGTWYVNEKVSELLTNARNTGDPEERFKNYAEAQYIAYYEDAINVPLNFNPQINAYRSNVKGYRTLTMGAWWLRTLKFE